MVATKILVPPTTVHTINSMVHDVIRITRAIRPDNTPQKVDKVDLVALQKVHQIAIWGIAQSILDAASDIKQPDDWLE